MKKMHRRGEVTSPEPQQVNPIILINSYPALVETSVINQDVTTIQLGSSSVDSLLSFGLVPTTATGSFTFIVNVLLYTPGKPVLPPMTCQDRTPPTTDGTPVITRTYTNVFNFHFGFTNSTYQQAMFMLNKTGPQTGILFVDIKHTPCKRRIITVDQFANLNSTNPVDQFTGRTSPIPGTINIGTGLTAPLSQPLEMAYAAIAIGRDFTRYSGPTNTNQWIPVQDVSTNIDPFDATLKTYYNLTNSTDPVGVTALASSNLPDFTWGAAVQTFKADTM